LKWARAVRRDHLPELIAASDSFDTKAAGISGGLFHCCRVEWKMPVLRVFLGIRVVLAGDRFPSADRRTRGGGISKDCQPRLRTASK
jgi:hypothetical protein